MRSRASFSASSAAGLQEAAAASSSAGVTRKPVAPRSTRSNFLVNSISAASPRAATSPMIARTACSTSAEAPSRSIGFGKFHREEIEDSVPVGRLHVAAAQRHHPLEPQRGAAALVAGVLAAAGFPVESIEAEHQPLFRGKPHDISDLHYRVLQ